MATTVETITITQGQHFEVDIDVANLDEVSEGVFDPVATAYFEVEDKFGNTVISKSTVVPSQAAIIDDGATSGAASFRVFLVPDDSDSLLGSYLWDAWVSTVAGKRFPAKPVSKFKVLARVVELP